MGNDEGLTFYRCCLCKRIVSMWDLKEHHACANCGHARVQPCNLTIIEKLRQVLKHPKVWKWNEVSMSDARLSDTKRWG